MEINQENSRALTNIKEQGAWNNFDGEEIAKALEIGIKGGDIVRVYNSGQDGENFDVIEVVANAEGCLNLLTGIFMGADELHWSKAKTEDFVQGELYRIRAWWD